MCSRTHKYLLHVITIKEVDIEAEITAVRSDEALYINRVYVINVQVLS